MQYPYGVIAVFTHNFMELATFKPVLTALVLPPTSALLLAGLGLMLWRRRLVSFVCIGLAMLSLWLLSSHGFAVMLARAALPQVPALEGGDDTPHALKTQGVQAIVVLGGGVESHSREYGAAQLRPLSITRLHYGMVLSRTTHLPLAFSGGIGWSATAAGVDTEAAAAARWLAQVGGPMLRWSEGGSRDTAENAQAISQLLKKDGIERIALVTHASHMPRALRAFEGTGLHVIAAPTAYAQPLYSRTLEWLPSAEGLILSQTVLRERLALTIQTIMARP